MVFLPASLCSIFTTDKNDTFGVAEMHSHKERMLLLPS